MVKKESALDTGPGDIRLLPRLLVNQLGFEEETGKDASRDN